MQDEWAQTLFSRHRAQLLVLAQRHLNPVLARRVTAEDVVQETFLAACKRPQYFLTHTDVPEFFKLRTVLFQTLAGLQRKHLESQKRDAYKEIYVADGTTMSVPQLNWDKFADGITGPLSRLARQDRQAHLLQILETLPENDRQILQMRHFDNLSNTQCAEALHIAPKAASIRYVRALTRLKNKLEEITEFRP